MINAEQTNSKSGYIIVAILFIAFAIRVWGINFGLPYVYDPDEPCYTNRTVRFFTGDLNPHWFGHPGSSLMYSLFFLYTLFFCTGKVFGCFSNISQFIALYCSDPTVFYLIGRFMNVVLGTYSVYLLYKIAKKLFDDQIALISSLIFAVASLHVGLSKVIRTDIIQTMLILLVFYHLITYIDTLKIKYFIFSSLFTGFAIATKWPSVLLLVPIFMTLIITEMKNFTKTRSINSLSLYAIILFLAMLLCGTLFLYINKDTIIIPFLIQFSKSKNIDQSGFGKLLHLSQLFMISGMVIPSVLIVCLMLGNLKISNFKIIMNFIYSTINNKLFLISLAVIAGSFFIAAPFAVLDFGEAISCILYEARDFHLGSDNLSMFGNFMFYIKESFNTGFAGIFIELLSLTGIFFCLNSIKKLNIKHLIVFSFTVIYFLSITKLPLHWDRWIVPIIPFVAILASVGLNNLISCLGIKKISKNKIVYPTLILLLINPLQKIIISNYTLSQKDTRSVAKEWVESNLPENAIIAYEHYAPYLDVRGRKNFKLIDRGWEQIVSLPLIAYVSNHVDYIIITDSFKNRYYKESDRYKIQVSRYEELETACEKTRVFKPKRFQPGPEITIYKLPK